MRRRTRVVTRVVSVRREARLRRAIGAYRVALRMVGASDPLIGDAFITQTAAMPTVSSARS